MSWNGQERRKPRVGEETPMIILIEMRADLKNHLKNYQELKDDFHEHKLDDTKNFGVLNKAYWIGIGALAVIQIFLGIHK